MTLVKELTDFYNRFCQLSKGDDRKKQKHLIKEFDSSNSLLESMYDSNARKDLLDQMEASGLFGEDPESSCDSNLTNLDNGGDNGLPTCNMLHHQSYTAPELSEDYQDFPECYNEINDFQVHCVPSINDSGRSDESDSQGVCDLDYENENYDNGVV